jgi:hypothetical protein
MFFLSKLPLAFKQISCSSKVNFYDKRKTSC